MSVTQFFVDSVDFVGRRPMHIATRTGLVDPLVADEWDFARRESEHCLARAAIRLIEADRIVAKRLAPSVLELFQDSAERQFLLEMSPADFVEFAA
ncbi:MAG: hypothetical protein ABIP54_04235 [Candidatus Andersenbacteria bacterium]